MNEVWRHVSKGAEWKIMVNNCVTQKRFEQPKEAPKIDVVRCITSPPLTSVNVSITFMHPKPCWHAPLYEAHGAY